LARDSKVVFVVVGLVDGSKICMVSGLLLRCSMHGVLDDVVGLRESSLQFCVCSGVGRQCQPFLVGGIIFSSLDDEGFGGFYNLLWGEGGHPRIGGESLAFFNLFEEEECKQCSGGDWLG
jgi:hypothetical protein